MAHKSKTKRVGRDYSFKEYRFAYVALEAFSCACGKLIPEGSLCVHRYTDRCYVCPECGFLPALDEIDFEYWFTPNPSAKHA